MPLKAYRIWKAKPPQQAAGALLRSKVRYGKDCDMHKTQKELAAIKKLKEELKYDLWHLEFLEKGGVIGQNCDLYTEKLDVFKEVVEYYKNDNVDFWKAQVNWSVGDSHPQRRENQKAFLEQVFYPYLDSGQYVCDLGAGNGEWSFAIADKVKYVDAFEYSDHMVETAAKKAKEQGIFQVSFRQADAKMLEFDRQYDNFMMMGLLTYIFEKPDLEQVLGKVYEAMKPGARLVVKDSVNLIEEDEVFLYNYQRNYQAVYRSCESYLQMFEKAGFILEQAKMLEVIEVAGIKLGSLGALVAKK